MTLALFLGLVAILGVLLGAVAVHLPWWVCFLSGFALGLLCVSIAVRLEVE